jgi:hypothetical protein
MNTHTEMARLILKALVDRDLIAVRSNDAAIDLLAREISEADRAAVVDKVLKALEDSDLIDEIYASDRELGEVIAGVLPLFSSTNRLNERLSGDVQAEYWVEISDGFAHETWNGPFATVAAAEAQGWKCSEGISATLFRRAPGKPDELIKRLAADGRLDGE